MVFLVQILANSGQIRALFLIGHSTFFVDLASGDISFAATIEQDCSDPTANGNGHFNFDGLEDGGSVNMGEMNGVTTFLSSLFFQSAGLEKARGKASEHLSGRKRNTTGNDTAQQSSEKKKDD